LEELTTEDRVNEIAKRLLTSLPTESWHRSQDAFQALIAVILSQNTSSANSIRAYNRLKEKYEVKPEVLAQLDPEEIKPFVRIAGMHERRSHRIIDVSNEILQRYNGNLERVLRLPLEEARKELMSIKGVGPKTADVVLASKAGKPVLPIDTNIFRILNRTGLVKGRKYEEARIVLESGVPPEKRWAVHLSLIRLGREICKPKGPLHSLCPIEDLCEKIID
jgi:endonuclease-3